MAQSHAKRWIIQMKDGAGKWVRSFSYPKPFFTLEEANTALAEAQASENGQSGIQYKLRMK